MNEANFEQQTADVSELADRLGELQGGLAAEEQEVFAEMIGLAMSQAQELTDELASEVVGGAAQLTRLSVYIKPISAVATLNDLRIISRLGDRLVGAPGLIRPTLLG